MPRSGLRNAWTMKCAVTEWLIKNAVARYKEEARFVMVCIGCYPARAIEKGKRSVGKPRYQIEEVKYKGRSKEIWSVLC